MRHGRFLDAHRHHDVLVIVAIPHRDQGAGIGVTKRQQHLIGTKVLQHVEQVRDIEADVERLAAVDDLQLLFGLFLLAVGTDDLQGFGCEHDAHTAEFFV